nr:MFS transporter [Thermodesulfobium acidiphilum]
MGQGTLLIDFPLYLHHIGWNAISIGALFSASLFINGILSFIFGLTAGKYDKKKFILGFQIILILCATIALLTSNNLLLGGVAIIGGFGRSGMGGSGPFAVIEVSWLNDLIKYSKKSAIFSLNNSLIFCGMSIGTMIATIPEFLSKFVTLDLAFRSIFLTIIFWNIICFYLIAKVKNNSITQSNNIDKNSERMKNIDKNINKRENKNLLLLFALNLLNGISLGFIMPLLPYWFKLKFNSNAFDLGIIFTISLFMTSLSSIISIYVVKKIGAAKTVIFMRFGGLISLVLMIYSPSSLLAAFFYILRSFLNRGNIGARQALVTSITRNKATLALSINNFSQILSLSIGPFITGIFFAHKDYITPFIVGAAFQTFYLVCFYMFFKKFEV